MKLQYKLNIRFIASIILVFIAAGIIFYILLVRVVHKNIDEMLRSRKESIVQFLSKYPPGDSVFHSPDNTLYIQNYSGNKMLNYSDTLMYDIHEKEPVPFRKLTFTISVQDKTYIIDLVQSQLESEDLIEVIVYFMLGLFVFLLLVLFLINYSLSFSIWKPFFNTLEKLKSIELDKPQNIHFTKTDTYEFDILNDTLNNLTEKLQADFLNLKEFTENASHEIQTPLAIIKSNLEMSLHDASLPENHRNYIHAAYESAIRLSKLNEALLLLSRIENRQFVDESEIDLTLIIRERLKQVEELADLRKIRIEAALDNPFTVKMNPYLAEIIVNNLINNALKHNITDGEIRIKTDMHSIIFSNHGEALTLDPKSLFKRFVKHSSNKESTGLGLAIASEICSIYHLSLQYTYQNGMHSLTLSKNS